MGLVGVVVVIMLISIPTAIHLKSKLLFLTTVVTYVDSLFFFYRIHTASTRLLWEILYENSYFFSGFVFDVK